MTRTIAWIGLANVLIISVGCHSPCCRKDAPPLKPLFVAPPTPLPPGPPPPPSIQQAQGYPIVTQPGGVVNPSPLQPGPAPTTTKTPGLPNDSPTLPRQTEEPPLSESRRDVPPRIQLYAPEPVDKEGANQNKPNGQRSLPAIPQFAKDKENVYAGLRPKLDGLDWLQEAGVKTVVNVRLFGEDDSADKKEVEKRGMRYIAFEVSPEVLSKEKADEFVQIIRDGARQGIFVYDSDGSLAGSIWYLYLRLGELLDDDAARIRARALGLRTDGEGQHRDMWLAAKKIVNEK
jgi:hypothetical protein